MNKKISVGAAVSLIFLVATLVFALTMSFSEKKFNNTMNALQEREKSFSKLAEIAQIVRNEYYGTIDETQLNIDTAKGYLTGTGDFYATYYTASEYSVIQREANTQSDLVGIGASMDVSDDGYILVKEVYPDSPAAVVGIEEGDLIIGVDDVVVTSENNTERMDSILGLEGSSVSLTVRRGGVDETKEVLRRSVAVPTVTAQLIPDTTIAYIRISNFTTNTYNQFNTAYQQMSEAGATSIIFDVRDNPGEEVSAAVRLLDRLVPEGPILGTKFNDAQTDPTIETSNSEEIDLPMAVLVNDNTKSAAEIFALVLQDYKKAAVVGVTTAGQGLRQDTFLLSDGSAIVLTVAEYFSPKTNTYFNEVGVKPNYEVVLPISWMGIPVIDDVQLMKAIERINSTLKSNGIPVIDMGEEALQTVLTDATRTSASVTVNQSDTTTTTASTPETTTSSTDSTNDESETASSGEGFAAAAQDGEQTSSGDESESSSESSEEESSSIVVSSSASSTDDDE